MVDLSNYSLSEIITTASLAAITLALGLKKLLKEWKSTSAETSIITMMHSELERMNAQNTILSKELNRLQQEMLDLNIQLSNLCLENQRLQIEVVALTEEISKFKEIASAGRN